MCSSRIVHTSRSRIEPDGLFELLVKAELYESYEPAELDEEAELADPA